MQLRLLKLHGYAILNTESLCKRAVRSLYNTLKTTTIPCEYYLQYLDISTWQTTVNGKQRDKWTKKGKTGNEKKIVKTEGQTDLQFSTT